MGAPWCGEPSTTAAATRRRLCVPLLATLGALSAPSAAQATFHEMLIREVYPGSAAAPQSSYVELQMYSAGQNLVGGHAVTLKNATGGSIGAFTFPESLPGSGVSQQTILVGDTGVAAAFGVTPDLVDEGFTVPASGGAACWGTIDCVSWGEFSGSTTPSAGTPVDAGGIPDGKAIRRKISAGSCTNRLDAGDDTGNDSATSFADASPAPISYATVPSPPACTPPPSPPTTAIDNKPANPTKVTSASFTYHSTPAGATFECRLDAEAFAACEPSGKSFAGPLTEATHSFQIRATDGNGTGPTASYPWTIDLTAPTATIDSSPAARSAGNSVTFKYHASEIGATFECRLDAGALAGCAANGITYTGLADGFHAFQVRAKDKATNLGAPAEYEWEVDNSLADTTPPETNILTRPANPSESTNASFTYTSNEPGSTFQCKLDAGAFEGCPASGITYTGLADGPHSFQVRAIDTSANIGSAAGYSWDIAAPSPIAPPPVIPPPAAAPETTIVAKPPARTRDRTPTLRFRSSVRGASYRCSIDRKRFKACPSPFTTPSLGPGRHAIRVKAVAGGVADPTPASCSFKVIATGRELRR